MPMPYRSRCRRDAGTTKAEIQCMPMPYRSRCRRDAGTTKGRDPVHADAIPVPVPARRRHYKRPRSSACRCHTGPGAGETPALQKAEIQCMPMPYRSRCRETSALQKAEIQCIPMPYRSRCRRDAGTTKGRDHLRGKGEVRVAPIKPRATSRLSYPSSRGFAGTWRSPRSSAKSRSAKRPAGRSRISLASSAAGGAIRSGGGR